MSEQRPSSSAESAAERRRRLDAIFGDTLPDTTADERDPAEGRDDGGRGDAWLRAQVPPHHGS
ncbi:hypothetical protein GCM10009623_25640 [Nocardioides aestuarii]|uniref:Uncharacterized protein n=1 Tax=Nocardioides aestuarii TaxID=252231 RepID=A0ABW4TPS3_9ACTN